MATDDRQDQYVRTTDGWTSLSQQQQLGNSKCCTADHVQLKSFPKV